VRGRHRGADDLAQVVADLVEVQLGAHARAEGFQRARGVGAAAEEGRHVGRDDPADRRADT